MRPFFLLQRAPLFIPILASPLIQSYGSLMMYPYARRYGHLIFGIAICVIHWINDLSPFISSITAPSYLALDGVLARSQTESVLERAASVAIDNPVTE